MKWHKILSLSAIIILIFAVADNCKKVTGGLDDQSGVLIVNIETVGAITISETNKVYLIYYANDDWTNPWFTQSTSTNTILNPVVTTFSTFVAAFWDANGNGVVDAGEPCIGYDNAYHNVTAANPTFPNTPRGTAPPDKLTPLTFIPLQWRAITMTLDATVVY